MTELQKGLDRAFNGLAVIPVRGDNVEVMASVREHLRRAFELAGEKDDG